MKVFRYPPSLTSLSVGWKVRRWAATFVLHCSKHHAGHPHRKHLCSRRAVGARPAANERHGQGEDAHHLRRLCRTFVKVHDAAGRHGAAANDVLRHWKAISVALCLATGAGSPAGPCHLAPPTAVCCTHVACPCTSHACMALRGAGEAAQRAVALFKHCEGANASGNARGNKHTLAAPSTLARCPPAD